MFCRDLFPWRRNKILFIFFLESTLELEPVIDDLKGDLKETFETYNELFYSCQDKIQKQNELHQVCLFFIFLYSHFFLTFTWLG